MGAFLWDMRPRQELERGRKGRKKEGEGERVRKGEGRKKGEEKEWSRG